MTASSSQILLASLDPHCRKGTPLIPQEKTLGICCSALGSPFSIDSSRDLWFWGYLLPYFNKT